MGRLRTEAVAGDQLGVVEVVARVHAHARRQAPAHGDFLVLVEQRDLDAVYLAGVGGDDAQRGVHGCVEVGGAPVAFQRRVEHVAQPVQHHGLPGLTQYPVVDALVVGGVSGHAGQGAAGHHDQLAAQCLDGFHLLLVAADHVIHCLHGVEVQVIGAAAAGDQRARHVFRGVERAADQLQRAGPVQPHAALGRVHGLGHAQAQRPQVAAVGDGGVPVDRGGEPRVDSGQRIGDHVRGRVGDAVEAHAGRRPGRRGTAQRVGLERAARRGQGEGQGHTGIRKNFKPNRALALMWRAQAAIKYEVAARRSSAARPSSAGLPRPAERPWRLRAASTCRARLPPRGG